MARFDAIEAGLSDLEARLVSVDDRTSEQAVDLKTISDQVEDIDRCVGNIDNGHDCCAADAVGLLDELAEDARRRERLQWMAEARAAMKAS